MKRFLIAIHTIALVIACLSVPLAIFIVLKYVPVSIRVPTVTNADLMSTILAALTIILGIVAVIIAGLAIWGYHAIKEESGNIAREEAQKTVTEYFSGIEVQARLRDEVGRIASEEAAKALESLDLSSAFQLPQIGGTMPVGSEEKEKPIGRPYPKGQERA
jgi:hypothetical protein